jgi:UDP-GlcNAc:undecaprenyl-phosphate GlcNAc-1-phosphate transferase
MIQEGIGTLFVGAVTTWAVTPAVARLGHRLGAVDAPGPRKIHAAPVPRIGGLAVFAGFLASAVFAVFATGYWEKFPEGAGEWSVLAAGAASMLILGTVDDIRGVSFHWKFLFQILAGLAAWLAGFRIDALTIPLVAGPLELGGLSVLVTILWVVGVTNALNLIDGLDGLAAGSAMITCTAVATLAFWSGNVAEAAISAALVGSLVGFLRYNFNPARIFLGDSGSMFLGFVLASISIRASQKNTTTVAVLVPVLVLGLPLFDTAFAVLRRSWRLATHARPDSGGWWTLARRVSVLFLPDRGHIHHRLLDSGMSHRGAVLVLYGVATVLAAIALLDAATTGMALGTLGALALALFFLVATLVWTRLRILRRKQERNARRSGFVPGEKRVGNPSS